MSDEPTKAEIRKPKLENRGEVRISILEFRSLVTHHLALLTAFPVLGAVRDQQVEGFLIFFNRREAANGLVEAVIVLIVIHQGYFPHQDAILRTPKLVVETGRNRDAFPR